jgi:hypothetical protein
MTVNEINFVFVDDFPFGEAIFIGAENALVVQAYDCHKRLGGF